MSPTSLAGVFPPVVTPFKDNGDLDPDSLSANLEKLNQQPLAGYVLGGSNGEFTSLTVQERLEVVGIARQIIPRDRLLIAGSGLESTRATLNLTEKMAKLGADVVIVVTPGYFKNKMTAAALEAFYREVADHAAVPVLLYSVPANTGVDLPAAAVAKLAAHPNIIGLKDSGGDITKIGQMVFDCAAARPDFQVLAGSAGFFLPALAVGAVGGVMALANIAGPQLHAVYAKFQAGDLAGARAAHLRLIEANTAVTARFGVAGLKAAMELLGYRGGQPRGPLLPLAEDERPILKAILVKAGLLG